MKVDDRAKDLAGYAHRVLNDQVAAFPREDELERLALLELRKRIDKRLSDIETED